MPVVRAVCHENKEESICFHTGTPFSPDFTKLSYSTRVRENGQVVGDGEEKHLGTHSQRGHFPGDLLDTHVQAVELLLGGGQFRGDCLCSFCGRIQLF